ncbi:MAG: hypothetical protein HY020_05425 [Burkholderiales bacterium]|nr:hypothetical protein [Burkholderiales bacterium]
MSNMLRLLLVAASATFLVGCAGTNFKRPDAGALEVGKSTAAQVAQVMGAPQQTGELLRNGEKLKQSRYAYAEGAGSGKYPGVTPARAQVFLTFNDLLVAEEFVSSFPNDATDFDDSKIGSIVKGKSTRADVIALLGNPNGRGIHPFIKNKGETAFIYSYSHVKGSVFNMKFYAKSLVVSFDAGGLVTDVEYTSNGEK